jgi:hypothetical protein
MKRSLPPPLMLLLLLVASAGCNHHREASDDIPTPALGPPPKPYLLHLPGIGGTRRIDRMLTEGLVQGGIDADVEIHDWTGSDEGMNALYARQRHEHEADIVAQMITDRFRTDPRQKIILSGPQRRHRHRGVGPGTTAGRREGRFAAAARVGAVARLRPFSRAAARARQGVRALQRPRPVLGVGTRMFGTIDGVKSDAAGRVGFTKPKDAVDPAQYDKLVQIAYDSRWVRLNNIGDHIGAMMRPFAREVLSPLLQTGVLREIVKATTRPATRRATTTGGGAMNPWPLWKKVLAYALLAALAAGSIWFIDRRAVVPSADGKDQRAAQ